MLQQCHNIALQNTITFMLGNTIFRCNMTGRYAYKYYYLRDRDVLLNIVPSGIMVMVIVGY